MKKQGKIIVACLTGLVLVFALAACGKTPGPLTERPPEDSTDVAIEPETPEPEMRELPPGGTVIGGYTWYSLPKNPSYGDIVGYKTDWDSSQEDTPPDACVAGEATGRTIVSMPEELNVNEKLQVMELLMGFSVNVIPENLPSDASVNMYTQHYAWGWTAVMRYSHENVSAKIIMAQPGDYVAWRDFGWVNSDFAEWKTGIPNHFEDRHINDAGHRYYLWFKTENGNGVNSSLAINASKYDQTVNGRVTNSYAITQPDNVNTGAFAHIVMQNEQEPWVVADKVAMRLNQ
jgi:predicted small lipoprotein YifL